MSDDADQKTGAVSDAMNAAANLAKAVPVYEDALQPIMKETGKALSTVGRALNVALAPIRGAVWGAEQVEQWLSERVEKKLENTPAEDIVPPDLAIAGPTIEALRFNGHKAELSEMFAGLLAGAMNKEKSSSAHPAYVEIIKSMTSLDARIFAELIDRSAVPTMHIERKFKDSNGRATVYAFICPTFVQLVRKLHPNSKANYQIVQSSVENLHRLGLVAAKADGELTASQHVQAYSSMKNGDYFKPFAEGKSPDYEFIFKKSYVILTQFGRHLGQLIF